ncbi:Serine/threonine protein kinase PrkC, regulator of stationary phase [Chitinispirillum alkaliphilum]|nr:Serine/threonine protein kinase PrkC, regulator of stationary phase [Chitinispirillum alkaliphilum]
MKNISNLVYVVLATLGLVAFILLTGVLFPVLEHLFYDMSFLFSKDNKTESVVIVGIDAQSVEQIGAMPWPRSTLAELIGQINEASPRVIAPDMLFVNRPLDPGTDSLSAVYSRCDNLVLGFRLDGLHENKSQSGHYVTPEAYRHRFLLLQNSHLLDEHFAYRASRLNFGDSAIVSYAQRAGFLNVPTSRSTQKLREVIHVMKAGEDYYSSFGLAAAAQFLKASQSELALDGKGSVSIRDISVPLTYGSGSVLLNYRGEPGTVPTYSAYDVLNGNVPASALHDKLVFVGVTDPPSSPSDFFITPAGVQYPGVEVWATSALDIIHQTWIRRSFPFTILNFLVLFLLFPGCALLFRQKKHLAVISGVVIFLASLIGGVFVLQGLNTFWNTGHHLYALLFLLIWNTFKKSETVVMSNTTFKLEPLTSNETSYLAPPEKDYKLPFIPQTESAKHVASVIKESIPQTAPAAVNLDQTMVETDLSSLASAVADGESQEEHVISTLEKISDGKIIRVLGCGGMADVYLIYHPRLEVYRAVKVLKPGQQEGWVERFETEVRIFANLNHPNIVQCYGVGDWHGLPYLEMEYVCGVNLEDVINEWGPLKPTETLAIGLLVCRALQYAHNHTVTVYGKTYKGIIHRDLKPANILLSKTGHIKITDFGIARPGDVSIHTMDSGNIVGTLPYLAPEQLSGNSVSNKADIYALGAILYECAAGKRAFPQTDITTLLSAKTNGQLNSEGERIFPQLKSLCHNTLQVDPQKRYSSAAEMSSEIEDALVSLKPDSENYLLAGLVKRVFGNS